MRDLSDREISLVMSFGALHYNARMIADNLDDISLEEVTHALKNKDSPLAKAYQKGKSRSQFKIDAKLLEQAQGGDIQAIRMLERRQREIQAEDPPADQDVL